jgi:hypothetical protein
MLIIGIVLSPQPGGPDRRIGRAAADGHDEGSHVLETRAGLLAVKVHRGAADGDHVENREFQSSLPPRAGPGNPSRLEHQLCNYENNFLLMSQDGKFVLEVLPFWR